MSTAQKKTGPARGSSRGRPQGDESAGQNARANSRGDSRSAQLLNGKIDSRTEVVIATARREREQAAKHRTSQARRAELVRICRTTFGHHERMQKALTTGWLTAEEAEKYLDTRDAQARLSGLRKAGLPLIDRWVMTCTATGNTRRVKAYRKATGSEVNST